MTDLTFGTLRGANAARLPQFKNNKGGLAHSRQDGSDWSPAQWLQAVVGELGEWAEARIAWESGEITAAEYEQRSAKELADVATYLDILARRSLDKLPEYATPEGTIAQGFPFFDCPSQALMKLIVALGTYANARKKLERGDYTHTEYLKVVSDCGLAFHMKNLIYESGMDRLEDGKVLPHPGDNVTEPHATGVDLGAAVVDKFNEVSGRVGSTVFIADDNWSHVDVTRK